MKPVSDVLDAVVQAPPELTDSALLMFGAALLAIGMAMGTLVLALGKYMIPGRNNFFARWGFTSVTGVVLALFAGMVIIPPLWVQIFGAELSLASSLTMNSLLFVAPSLLIMNYARKLDPDGVKSLGFRLEGSLRSAAYGLSSYVMLLPALVGTMVLWPFLLRAVGIEPETQQVMSAFFELEGWEILVPALFGVLIQPFFEELLFRSFLQPLLVQNFREVGGVVITSLIFGAMHGASVAGPTFVLSLIMGGVMQRTQRFSACFAVHALHNGLTVFLVTQSETAREFAEVSGLLRLF